MPTKEEHIAKAERNEAFAQTIAKTAYLDWAVTILFYAALHYADAVLAVSAAHPRKHSERHPLIKTNGTLRKVYSDYRQLEVISWNARYAALPITPDDWLRASQFLDIIRERIRTHMGLK